jgi:hypothetical protein
MDDRELTLTDLLADPMILAVMAADGIDPAALEAALCGLPRRLELARPADPKTGLRRASRSAMLNFIVHRPVFDSVIAIVRSSAAFP